MKYVNAELVLPKELLKQVQQYTQGNLIYIPKESERMPWGKKSGTRDRIHSRNKEITRLFNNGSSIKDLAKKFYLSEHTIRKIISNNR